MPYHRRHRKFGRERRVRNALIQGLASQVVAHEKIKTTQARAQTVRPVVEKLITQAKRPGITTIRLLMRRTSPAAVKKLTTELKTRYEGRPGGYTRITKLPSRGRDGARMAMIELV